MRQLLKHLFTPHHTNNHRARVLHVDALFVYALVFAAVSIVTHVVHGQAPQILGYATDIYADQLLTLTNAKRQEAGLPVLTMNPALNQAAAAKAQDMFANNYWAHNSPQGKTPWDFIKAAGYTYTVAGENLAKNFNDSAGVVNAWMDSPSHKENLLKPGYSDVGFAVVNGVLNGEETTLVVQMFGATSYASAPPVSTPEPAVPAGAAENPVTTVTPANRPVEVPETSEPAHTATPAAEAVGSTTPGSPPVQALIAGAFAGVSEHPVINLAAVTEVLVYGFIGFLMAVFLVDAFLVSRHKVVRVSGNNFTHMLFFAAIAVVLSLVSRGSIL